jgi:predicted permease
LIRWWRFDANDETMNFLENLFKRPTVKREIDEELRFHIEQRERENIAAGMTADEAAQEARKRFGNFQSVRENCREVRGASFGEALVKDIRFGARMLRKNPSFTAVAVLTLALGIGANTAIFSFVNAILLRPLPYKDPSRLVMVFEAFVANGSSKDAVGAPILGEWRKQATVFEGLAARSWDRFILTGFDQPENIPGAHLSANIFSLLGVEPLLGRAFAPEEETFGKDHVVLLSYELWQRRFGGDPKIVGQSITLNAEPHLVIGVMPPRTFFPDKNSQLWTPLAFSPDDLRQRHAHRYSVYGRLKPGVTLAQARAQMNLIAERMAQADAQNKGWGAEVYPLQEIMVGDSRRLLLVILSCVGLVLLIACANIANLLLARSATRNREFAIRTALGARAGQIVRQLLTESLLLAGLGGAAGVLFAYAGLQVLIRFSPPDLPRIWEGIHLDGLTMGFAMAVTAATGIAVGLAPAMQSTNPGLAQDLCESGRGASGGRQRHRLRSTLVMAEVALSLMLLVAAGLMMRSFSRLMSQNLGYNPEHLVSMDFGLPDKKYSKPGDGERFFERFLERVRALPDVQSAALVAGLPLSDQDVSLVVRVPDAPPPAPGQPMAAGYAQISPGYFRAMNIPMLQGRDFTEQDRSNTPPVVIVDQTFVKNFRLGANVIGRHIGIGDGTDSAEIIGLVADTKRLSLADSPHGQMFRSYHQREWGFKTLVVRTKSDPGEITGEVRRELDTIDKEQPIENVRTMTQLVSASVGQRQLATQLLGGFAGVAVLLAAIGLYGVLAGNVAQRTREIGIRMALGAQPADVVKLVLRQGMTLTAAGLAAGLIGALCLTHLLSSLLYEVKPLDLATFSAVPLLVGCVALCACYIPASRVTKVDPMVALRHE